MASPIPELEELDEILAAISRYAEVRTLCHVPCGRIHFPIHAITLGPRDDRSTPALCLVGGVHGLERIGTQVILAHMRGISAALQWDRQLRSTLQDMRLIFIPLVNPAGMYLRRRSNANGVDLMRNAPIDAIQSAPPYLLFRGHRLTARLPWYRGQEGQPMEVEARAVCEFIETELFDASLSIILDVHSGFAGNDRVWFPYARSKQLFPNVAEVIALKRLLNRTFPYHRYVVEPQAMHYTAHGDLWDYVYLRHHSLPRPGVLLPLTLELASAVWLRKNPRQLTSPVGLFHPVQPHRVRRVLRHHYSLLQFLMRATFAHEVWARPLLDQRRQLERDAMMLWGKHGMTPALT